MANFVTEQNIKLEPCDLFYGKKGSHTITTVADSSSSLNSTFVEFDAYNTDYTLVEYYAWFNVGAAGTDPAVADKTGIEVALTADDTAPAVAIALAAALDLDASLESSNVSNVVTYSSSYFGATTIPAAGSADPGFTYATVDLGKGGPLGATTGGIEIGMELGFVEVKADQTGDQLLDNINNATNVTVTTTLEELTGENLQLLIGDVVGESFDGTGGEKYFGIGESKRFQNMKQFGGQLICRPINATTADRNHTFYATVPAVESFTLSGTDLNALPVTFDCFRDTTVTDSRNIHFFGDITKLS